MAVEAGDADAVGVARPAAAALGEEHDRQPQLLGQLEQPVLLAVVLRALRAGQHRVVVGHHHARGPARRRTASPFTRRCRRSARRPACCSIRSSSVRRRRCAAMTSAPYSTKRARVARGRRRSPAPCAGRSCAGAPPRRAARRRAGRRAALEHLGEVGPDVVEVDLVGVGRRRRRLDVGLLDEHQRVALEDRVARPPRAIRAHDAAHRGADDVLHLHRLHHQQLLAGARRRRPRPRRWLTIVPCIGAAHRDGPVGPPAASPPRRAPRPVRRPARPTCRGSSTASGSHVVDPRPRPAPAAAPAAGTPAASVPAAGQPAAARPALGVGPRRSAW